MTTGIVLNFRGGNAATPISGTTFVETGTLTGTYDWVGIYADIITNITNAGTIVSHNTTPYGGGINLAAGSTFTNTATGTISAGNAVRIGLQAHDATGTVFNYGLITGPGGNGSVVGNVNITNGSSSNPSARIDGGVISANAGIDTTLINFGTIGGPGNDLGAFWGFGGGPIYNGASDSAAAYITGLLDGISSGGGNLTNFGRIVGKTRDGVGQPSGTLVNGQGGTILGARTGVGGSAVDVVNIGMIGATAANSTGLQAGSGNQTDIVINGAPTATNALVYGVAFGMQVLSAVHNYGTIEGTGTASIGLYHNRGGAIVNGISGSTIGLITGVYAGAKGGGQLTNFGQITATGTASIGVSILSVDNSGTIGATGGTQSIGISSNAANPQVIHNLAAGVVEGSGIGIRMTGAIHTLTNAGTIHGTGATSDGVDASGATITNTASGTISGATYGIYGRTNSYGAGPQITNNGLITGNIGLKLVGGALSALTNAGTITGASGTAVLLPGYANLTVLPGAVFNGKVTAPDDHTKNHLHLGSSATTGTIANLGVDFAGFGNIDITPGAHWVLTGTNDLSHVNVTGQFTINNGALNVSPGTTLTAQGTIATQGPAATIVNQGTIATVYATDLQVDAPIINTGTITAIADSTLHVTGTITSGDTASTGRIDLGNGAVAEFSAGLDSSQTVGFGTANEISQATVSDLADFQAAMADFGIGDSVDITGVTADFGDIADSTSGSLNASHGLFSSAQILPPAKMLRISNNGTILKQIPLTGTGTAPFVTLQPDGHGGTLLTGAAVACFAQGTRIDTPDGEIPIEHLRPGDKVISAFGGAVEIVWLGHRHVIAAAHATPADVWPIRIHAHALAAGVPLRDVLLSPEHAVHVNHHLVPARLLVNGASIVQEPVAAITYWHVELPQHDVIFANGLPAESYLDTGNRRAAFNTGAPPPEEDANTIWQSRACLPQLRAGPRLAAIRALLQPPIA